MVESLTTEEGPDPETMRRLERVEHELVYLRTQLAAVGAIFGAGPPLLGADDPVIRGEDDSPGVVV